MTMKRKKHKSILAILLLAASLASCDWETYDPNRFKKEKESQETPGNNQPGNQPGGQSGQEDEISYTYYLDFSDNVVMKVCSVSFGLHYEFVRYILEKHYGQPVYHVGARVLLLGLLYSDGLTFVQET